MSKKKPASKKVMSKASLEQSQNQVIQSSKAIEKMYELERQRIDNSVLDLEKERLNSYIMLIDKRKGLLNLKKRKLDELEKNIRNHARDVETEMSKLKKQKSEEKGHFDRLYHLNEHLKNVEIQIRDIAESRRTLLAKEKQMLDSLKEFLGQNKQSLREYGFDEKVRKLDGVLDTKTRIIAETAHLINEDIRNVFKDKRILESMTDEQLARVNQINNKLKGLTIEHSGQLKKLQKMQTEDFDFKEEFRALEEKKKSLIEELRRIAAMKKK